MVVSGITLILEIYPRSQHALVGVGFWMIWAVGYILVVPFVYFIRAWRMLLFVVTIPNAVFAFAYVWFEQAKKVQ